MVARLGKIQVERLLGVYDDDPVAALADALRIVLVLPGAAWDDLLTAAPITDERRNALRRHDQHALDSLAAELNELRTFAGRAEGSS